LLQRRANDEVTSVLEERLINGFGCAEMAA
jgi:hypothetical protein